MLLHLFAVRGEDSINFKFVNGMGSVDFDILSNDDYDVAKDVSKVRESRSIVE